MSGDWKEALAPTPDCLDLTRLGEKLSDAERAHVETCVRCRTELALFTEVMAEQASPASQWIAAKLERRDAKPAAAPRAQAFRVLYAVAAALILLAGASWWMRYREPSIDAGLSQGTYRGIALDVVGPSGDLAQAPNELRWKAVPNATRYHVAIVEVDGTQLWSADTTQSQIAVPREIRARFLPGKTLLWTVTAYRGSEELAVSPTQNVRVTP